MKEEQEQRVDAFCRKIIHIDMDCFYAAVEMREDPSLRDVPIAIGGKADRRGVIATCNYPARKFGVRSAMATAHALKLCPQLKLISGRMELYKQVSQQLRAIFHRYTDLVEPLSLDEAYLDVSECDACQGSATLIAEEIRATIKHELDLTASAGVAPNKYLAKIASDENKPDGIFVITPDQVAEFVETLPLQKIPGVGKATLARLHAQGLYTASDVQRADPALVEERFGKFGRVLLERCQGIDSRSVEPSRVRKSVGVETTLARDIHSADECLELIQRLYPELQRRLKKAEPSGVIAKQGLKLKFDDFTQTTVEQVQPLLDYDLFPALLEKALTRQHTRGIRLVGLHVGLSEQKNIQQLTLHF